MFPSKFIVTWLQELLTVNYSALLTAYDWLPSYLFTNVVLILIGIWASRDKTGFEPVITYIVAVVMSILNDMILLGLYFSDTEDAVDSKFNNDEVLCC